MRYSIKMRLLEQHSAVCHGSSASRKASGHLQDNRQKRASSLPPQAALRRCLGFACYGRSGHEVRAHPDPVRPAETGDSGRELTAVEGFVTVCLRALLPKRSRSASVMMLAVERRAKSCSVMSGVEGEAALPIKGWNDCKPPFSGIVTPQTRGQAGTLDGSAGVAQSSQRVQPLRRHERPAGDPRTRQGDA